MFGLFGKPKVICENCGSVGRTVRHVPGSLFMEILLWLCFLLPGMIYTVWRSAKAGQVCKQCGSNKILPINTPRGRMLAEQYSTAARFPLSAHALNLGNKTATQKLHG